MEQRAWDGRYELFEEIASGGMATVYLAGRLEPSETVPSVVAFKKLAPEFAKQTEFVAMFLDEARLAARIRHPNVLRTYEFLRAKEGLGIVMDLVIGESLVSLLRTASEAGVPPPLSVMAAVIVGALEGLHAAHEALDETGRSLRLVHRDVSPHNILVGADGVVRVIDFGIAKAAGRLQTTDVGVLKGKFAYMAPEQIQGADVSRASDVYAVGLVLWEGLTGRRLFNATSNEELLTQRSRGDAEVTPPSHGVLGLPKAFDAIVACALAHDPRARFATAREMGLAIREVVEVAEERVVASWVLQHAAERVAFLSRSHARIAQRTSRQSQVGNGPSAAEFTAELILDGAGSASPTTTPSLRDRKLPRPPRRKEYGGVLDIDSLGSVGGDREDVHFELHAKPLPRVAPAASSFGREPRAKISTGETAPRDGRRPRGGRPPWVRLVLPLLFVGVSAFAYFRGPFILASWIIQSARAYGFDLKVSRVAVTTRGFALSGVKAAPSGQAAIRVDADEVFVDLSAGASPCLVRAQGYELVIMGSPASLEHEVASWRGEQPRALTLEASSGHVVWTAFSWPDVSVEALDVSVSGSLTGQLAFDTASAFVSVPRGHLGPWSAHAESTVGETRLRLGFDPSRPNEAPSATFVDRAAEGETLTIDIPRGSSYQIGVPSDLLGPASDLGVELTLRAHVGTGGHAIDADGRLGLYGLQRGASRADRAMTDLILSGSLQGDPERPLPLLDGKLSSGKTTSNVIGLATLRPDGLRIEVRPRTGAGEMAPPIVFDTHDWTGPLTR